MYGGRKTLGLMALLPFVAFLLIFAIYPLIEVVRLSLTETVVQNSAFTSTWNDFQNFSKGLTAPDAIHSFLVTSAFVVLAVGLTLVFGVGLALLVERARLVGTIAKTVLLWPAVVTPVVVSVMWLLILDPTIGGINRLGASLGLPAQGWLNDGLGAFLIVVAVDVWHWTPIVYLFVFTAIRGLDREVFEAARVDGATEGQIVRNIMLPLLRPAIIVAATIRLVMSVKAFDEMYVLTQGGPNGATDLISLYIQRLFFAKFDFGSAAAVSLTVVLGVVVVAVAGTAASRIRKGVAR